MKSSKPIESGETRGRGVNIYMAPSVEAQLAALKKRLGLSWGGAIEWLLNRVRAPK